MSDPRSIPPDLLPYFEAEARRASPSLARRAAVLSRVAESAALAAAANGTAASGAALGASAAGGGTIAAIVGKPGIVALAFVLGTATGAGLHARFAPAPVPVATATAARIVLQVPAAAPSPTPRAAEVTEVAPPATERAARGGTPPAASGSADAQSLFKEELALIESANRAIGAGDASGALKHVARHAERFPNGALAQEREVIRVRALAAAGNREEAKTRAEKFRERFPDSAYQRRLDEATHPAP